MPLRKRGETAFVASAQSYRVADYGEALDLSLQRQPWQARAWHYYDDVGEIHYAGRYIANCLSRIRLVAAVEDGEAPELVTDQPKVTEAVRQIGAGKGGQRTFLRRTGLNLFVTGEMMMLGEDAAGKQSWEALSINELRWVPGATAERIRYPGAPPQPLPNDALVIRVWNEHPQYTGLADSAIRSVLDQCEQLLLLTRAEKAAARSRFAGAGLLGIPIELVPPSWQNQGRGDDPSETNPLIQQLTDAMMTPLKDEGHPSSVVPVMMFGPSEYIDKIKHISFDRPIDKSIVQQKEECIKRIAAAIDLPPEVLQGMGDTNHWSASQIHDESFAAHIQPFIELIVDGLTEGYLHPALQRAGVKDYEKYVVWYDETLLVQKPTKKEEAIQAHDRLAISDASLRDALGFGDDDAITDTEEYNKRVGVKLADIRTAVTGETPPEQPDPIDIAKAQTDMHVQAQKQIAEHQASLTPADPGGRPPGPSGRAGPPRLASERRRTGAVSQGPRPGTDRAPQRKPNALTAAAGERPNLGLQLGRIDQGLLQQMRVHGDAAVKRATERAGARLRSRIAGQRDLKDTVASVPNVQVASVLGPSVVASLGLNDDDLVADEFGESEAAFLRWIRSGTEEALAYLRQYLQFRSEAEGLEVDAIMPTWEEQMADAGRQWRSDLLGLARRSIYQPLLPPTEVGEADDLSVPPKTARDVLLRAGGGPVSPADLPSVGGLATGRSMRDILSQYEVPVSGYVWMYGANRKRPFNSHLQLDGAVFDTFRDPVLEIWPEDAWLRRTHYTPQDHVGCCCVVAPYVEVYPG